MTDILSIWTIDLMFVLAVSIFCSGIVIPQILLIAFRFNMFDNPDPRKIHQGAVPRLGGLAFMPVVFFSVALMLGIKIFIGDFNFIQMVGGDLRAIASSVCAMMLIYVVGMGDDLIGVRYKTKFVMQILCALMLIGGGLWLNNLWDLFGINEISVWVGVPLTVMVIVFIVHSINLIDGIDGLASGLSSIVMIIYAFSFVMLGEYVCALLAIATLGVLVSFFYYNVFGDPNKMHKIFMGDTGSLTIGMLICILGLKLVNPIHELDFDWIPNRLVIVFSPLIVPCFDVVRVYLYRVRNHRNPFMPDKNHIHHKLLALGLPQRSAMVTIVLISLAFTSANILVSLVLNINWILLIDIVVWTLGNLWLAKTIRRKRKESKR